MANIYNASNDEVVGFKKEAEIILDLLIRGSNERDVVLIAGMAGLGKTTIARSIYDNKIVAKHFDVKAWCTISQGYDFKDLLHKIYSQVCDNKKQSDGSIAERLRKSLMGKRYLIVLDDIWSINAWEELSRVFPSSCNTGSRIVLTSRQENLVSDAKHVCLPFFTIDESWELLKVKLFEGKRCPEELENIGKKISKKCGGLPLIVGLVAGLLERVGKSEQMWHGFLNTLNSHSQFRDEIQSNEVIELSYKHLPNHLKPCLLYFAAFPEDEEVEVSYLTKLWIAEGFVEVIEKERVEDKAKDYLNDLVGSNLIMVSERNYNGHILRCIAHDLVRDFCLTKAKEKILLHIIKMSNDLDPSLNFTPHRLCFHRHRGNKVSFESVPWSSSVRTLLGSKVGKKGDVANIYDGSYIARKFEHLTILDLEFIYVDKSMISEVNSLSHLRYLALCLRGRGSISPSSLENLGCLVTLKLASKKDLHLPKFFWNMRSLKHMFIHHRCSSCLKEPTSSVIEGIPNSEAMETFDSTLPLSIRDELVLRKLPHLKNLSCYYSPRHQFPQVEFLNHLECLELFGMEGQPHFVNDLPSSVKEIRLARFTLSSSTMSIMGKLSKLEALKLQHCYIEGLKWNVEEDTEFPKLKYLELTSVILAVWKTGCGFPCLEQLILKDSGGLRELPSCLADIPTLKLIVVDRCNPYVERYADKILEDARDNIGNQQLKVKITYFSAKELYIKQKLMEVLKSYHSGHQQNK